jgi:hypothetical protein
MVYGGNAEKVRRVAAGQKKVAVDAQRAEVFQSIGHELWSQNLSMPQPNITVPSAWPPKYLGH